MSYLDIFVAIGKKCCQRGSKFLNFIFFSEISLNLSRYVIQNYGSGSRSPVTADPDPGGKYLGILIRNTIFTHTTTRGPYPVVAFDIIQALTDHSSPDTFPS
jgi:hypothetical protein